MLGLLVDGAEPRLSKEYKKYVSDHLYFLSRPDIDAETHAKRKRFDSVQGLLNHLSGKIAYGISIEPKWGEVQGEKLKQICNRLSLDYVLFP
ncbi:hypothetical protein D3C77_500030 [compost metagenome]